MTGDRGRTAAPSTATMLWRGARLRCAVCGEGGLFHRWFTMEERCPRCGLRFNRIEGHFIGALGMNTIVSFCLLFVVVVVSLVLSYPEFRMAPMLVAASLTAIVFPLLFFPFSRTLWTAIDLAMRPLEPGEADPTV